jgi:L-ascorbate metabolism protein UlaG (beta-lactamase superfamily)
MNIVWNGLSSFTITAKPADHEVTVVLDPYSNDVGLRFPRTLEAAMVVSSHDGPAANNFEALQGEERKAPFKVTHAGEYEVQGVFVKGVTAAKKDGSAHTVYRIDAEDLSIGFLGAIDRDLTEKEIEALGNIDVLIVPVGGGNVLNKDQAAELVSQIEPRLVIPSYYDVDGLKVSLASVEPFCKDLACPREDVSKLKLSKASLPSDEIKIAVLSRG